VSRLLSLREMTWREVDGLDRETTVITFACGPVEQHGPQTPLGTDLYVAERVMHECARRLQQSGYTVLISPTLPYVNALFSLPYPGSTSVRRSVVEDYLYDLLSSFATSGFGYLLPVSQHVDPPWARAAQSACDRVNAEHGASAIHGFERLVLDLLNDPSILGVQDLDLAGDAHAGIVETSLMLHLEERLVKREPLEQLSPQPVEFAEMGEVSSFREIGNGLGYTGDPARASAELGEQVLDYYITRFSELILRHLSGEDVSGHLRFSSF
jgi:creatinine amidohydrolase